MRDNKKVQYNLLMGAFGQIVTIILGIVVPRLVLTGYGSEVNGLLSSITNIYAYIAIVEAGISASARQGLYKSTSKGDHQQTNSILAACNHYYHKTGFIYLGLILLFSAIYPVLIKSEISYFTIVLIILLNGLGNVINYFFHGKYMILLRTDGKNYICTGIEVIINILKNAAKIILITLGFDVVVVQLAVMLASLLQMLCITYYIRKKYSWIDLSVEPNLKAFSQNKYVLVNEINYLLTFNVDTVMLTIFSDLKTVSIYSLYSMLFGVITRALTVIKDAFEFKIAHVFHTDQEAFLKMFTAYETCYTALAFSLFTIANHFILPFLRLYTRGVNDVNYIDQYLPYAFVFVQLLAAGRYPSDIMIHISGHFKQTMKSASIESILNVAISAFLVQKYGIMGVLIGSIVSSLYRGNYLILYVNKHVIKRSVLKSYRCWLTNICVYLGIMYLSSFVRLPADSYVQLVFYCVPYSIVIILIYFVLTFAIDIDTAKYIVQIITNRRGLVDME